MVLSYIWSACAVISLVYSLLNGTSGAIGTAALEGAGAAVELCISICGVICLWSGIMEILKRCGASAALSKLMKPLLKKLFPSSSNNPETLEAISGNISANILGLGNAATPYGIKAVKLMSRGKDEASDDMCRLVILNTASVQLIPSTVAALRAAAGSAAPFDILPAVWLTSAVSLAAGLLASKLFSKRRRKLRE